MPALRLLAPPRAYAVVIATIVLVVAGMRGTNAQTVPPFVAPVPLYCAGPLTTGAPAAGESLTPFRWAHAAGGASSVAPYAGHCAFAASRATGTEIQPGGGNSICDFSGEMTSVPAGSFTEVGAYLDPQAGNCMHLVSYVGAVSPPFSSVPALPPFVRQSIAALTPAQIASLQAGFAAMMSRPVTDPTSYRFQADVHGTTDTPTTAAQSAAWNQCEHASYFFFSWHRMYLYYFDRILRAASGNPNLVLPYWDWTDPAQRTLPLAFRAPATGNPLYLAPPSRPAALDAGTAALGAGTVSDSVAFADLAFETGGALGNGFGGGVSAPMQFSHATGDFENQPHNVVHSALGGLMGNPRTAAQDPIFWLHHANIDRLWDHWLLLQGGRTDPADGAWLSTTFAFYDEAGHAVTLTGAQVVSAAAELDYVYDDETPAQTAAARSLARRVAGPVVSPATARPAVVIASSATSAGAPPVALSHVPAQIRVPLGPTVVGGLRAVTRDATHEVFLRIDDLRVAVPPGYYYAVYIDPPPNRRLDADTPGFVGNFSLFSLAPHRMAGAAMGAPGDVTFDFDVTHTLARLLRSDLAGIDVVFVPQTLVGTNGEQLPLPAGAVATIGSVRLIER